MDHRRVSRLKIKPLPLAIVPQSVSDTAPESAPKSEGVPHGEQQDPSAQQNAQAEVLEMPAPNSGSAKKIRRAARKKSSKVSAETAVPSPDEPRPEDPPSSGPAHK